jgi:hypothetical protein
MALDLLAQSLGLIPGDAAGVHGSMVSANAVGDRSMEMDLIV